ncbi:MAG: hypothetical protein LHW59_05045 [Candidatus Cloacimonetes bacterium]|nr:hypothetical protein [Candidatus Cloacimonadota bacterium]
MDTILTFLKDYWILGYFIVVVLGVILGFGKMIIVFRDYADLGYSKVALSTEASLGKMSIKYQTGGMYEKD